MPPKRQTKSQKKSPSPTKSQKKSPSPTKIVQRRKRPVMKLSPFLRPSASTGIPVIKLSPTRLQQQQFPPFFYQQRQQPPSENSRYYYSPRSIGSSASSGFGIPSSTGGTPGRPYRIITSRSPRTPTF